MTENNINPIKRSYKKKDKYQKEQEEIVKRLNDILGLDKNNYKFILEELKQDQDKQNKILALEDDVKKYFAYNRWPFFNSDVNNEALSLMRSIYKNTNHNITYKLKMKNKTLFTEYSIVKKEINI